MTISEQSPADRIGEVIESSTTELIAQCDHLHQPPALGSLVVVRRDQTETYALVSYAETVSIDPGRRPVARGVGLTSEEELFGRHPELGQLLRTMVTAVVIAHRFEGEFFPYLPARPPWVHAFLYYATPEEASALADRTELLPTIAGARTDTGDAFIAASVRTLADASNRPDAYLAEAGRRLVLLFRGDPQRLQTLLPQLRPSGHGPR